MRFLLCVLAAPVVFAQFYGDTSAAIPRSSPLLPKIGINQRMGAEVPLDAPFQDEAGRDVTLADYRGKPVLLALVYYQCPSLCSMVLNGMLRAARELPMTAGREYEIVAVSFDPRETPSLAAQKREAYVAKYGRSGNGWHFLTGPETSSKKLADAVGFHYYYDSMTNQYGHASAIMILTPEGRVARYFYGIDYPPRDVRLGLQEAAGSVISTPTDQVLLYCFHYDPATGKYALAVMNVLRLGAVLTLAALLTFMAIMFRRDVHAGRGRSA